jgi:FMN phosphatase YigB (HAD superfamily)
MRSHEIQPSKLVIFDIDDTLVHTQTKVHVVKNGRVVRSLNSHEFTHYKPGPGEEFDFGDFRSAQEFFTKSRPIIPMIAQLKNDINTGNKVVMVTARADFDDRELFLDTFRKYGVDMSRVHVYRAGNIEGKIKIDEKKKIIIRSLLNKAQYSKAIMYDDSVPNLESFISLKKEYPQTKFYAWHVSLDGEASEYARTNEQQVTESTYTEHEDEIRNFIQWCVKKLNIEQALPKIRFQDPKEGPDQHRTGYYDDNTDTMWIYTGNRNLIDILRTVAHELTHRRQAEQNRVGPGMSYPGSPIEVEADAVAGVLMKLYAKKYPGIIE